MNGYILKKKRKGFEWIVVLSEYRYIFDEGYNSLVKEEENKNKKGLFKKKKKKI